MVKNGEVATELLIMTWFE